MAADDGTPARAHHAAGARGAPLTLGWTAEQGRAALPAWECRSLPRAIKAFGQLSTGGFPQQLQARWPVALSLQLMNLGGEGPYHGLASCSLPTQAAQSLVPQHQAKRCHAAVFETLI